MTARPVKRRKMGGNLLFRGQEEGYQMKKPVYAALLSLILAGLVLAGSCGNSYSSTQSTTTPPTSPTGPQGDNFEVTIQGEAFSPPSVNVPAGTTVHWTNLDSVTHTVTSDTGLFDGQNIGKNGTFNYTFSTKGTYSYHCSIHPFMKGTIIVE
jgi:plastocyanin